MSSRTVRADDDNLGRAAQGFSTHANNTRQSYSKILQVMEALQKGDWVGEGATAYYREMKDEVLPAGGNGAHFELTLPEAVFNSAQAQAAANHPELAAALLVEQGVEAGAAQSLAAALAQTDRGGTVAVLQPRQGGVAAGRKLEVFQGEAGTWLAWRTDPATRDVRLETAHAGTLGARIESFIQALTPAAEPAA